MKLPICESCSTDYDLKYGEGCIQKCKQCSRTLCFSCIENQGNPLITRDGLESCGDKSCNKKVLKQQMIERMGEIAYNRQEMRKLLD